jgi:nitroimidazol reductase NimA-like FMN-containing flavoprotein (pyridoxamine 5'-phosphate oxidase superfamily)
MLGKLPATEVERLLQSELIARIGCHVEGRTYVVPVAYVYADGSLIGHSTSGMKLDMLRKNPEVCVEVEHVDDLANWRSVIAWGRYEELSGSEAEQALALLMARFVTLLASETSRPASSAAAPTTHARTVAAGPTVVYRIRLAEKSGRFERSP